MFYKLKNLVKHITPPWVLSTYHYLWALLSAVAFNHPSTRITVIGVTGTKGKSSTIEFLNSIFEAAGYKTAIASTIRFKIREESTPNAYKMTMPGRFFLQKFIADSVRAECDILFVEMTSEGVKQHRHRFIALDGLIFTNLQREHIESHGSFENYAKAKLEIGHALERSPKRPRTMVANADDHYGSRFLSMRVENILPYTLTAAEPYTTTATSSRFRFDGVDMSINMPGVFMVQNALAAATMARAYQINPDIIAHGLASLTRISGRTEEINLGQDFRVVVDYAHTPDSLRALYEAYKDSRTICVLGSTGGGRDVWKRPQMGAIAEEYCGHIILTNEDPYDEDPNIIVSNIASGMKQEPEIIMDRHRAIRRAIELADANNTVLITGKGTDAYLMGARGKKEKWNDAEEARVAIKARMDATRIQ